MEDAGRTCRAGALLAACGRGVRRRRGASVIVPSAASHRSAVDDSHAELVLTHIDHPESIIWNRALGIDGVFQHGLNVFVHPQVVVRRETLGALIEVRPDIEAAAQGAST